MERQKKRWEDNIKEWTGMGFGDSLGQRKTGKGGKVLLQRHLWCPDDLRGYGTEMRFLHSDCVKASIHKTVVPQNKMIFYIITIDKLIPWPKHYSEQCYVHVISIQYVM